jgi:uncharacterized protein (TIGR00251 family)
LPIGVTEKLIGALSFFSTFFRWCFKEKFLRLSQVAALLCAEIMRIQVKVTPRAKRPCVETATDGSLVVKVREAAQAGRANTAVIEALAEHFGVPIRAVSIVHGQASRRKLVEIFR